MAPSTPTKMTHRFLGNSGLLVSKLALGSWMFHFDETSTPDLWYSIMATAFRGGINFFDTAENYGDGLSEKLLGGAIKRGIAEGVWSREDLVVSTKVFAGTKGFADATPNGCGLSRKHIIEGVRASLRRLELDYADVVFCHRPEPYTPIEETVRAMNHVLQQGWAFYWGTSEWCSADIAEACEIADRLGLVRPIMEQAQYNVFERSKVDLDYLNLYKKYNLGLTTWSPLASGTLTGKYSAGKPEGSRFTTPPFQEHLFGKGFAKNVALADKLKPIAEEVGCSMAQLAIAWCVSNERVSTVLVAGTKPSQIEENLKALEFVSKITPEVKAKMDAAIDFVPSLPEVDGMFAVMRGRFL